MSAPVICGCGCGCRTATRIAPVTDRAKGWTKGQPLRFLKGHNVSRDFGKAGSDHPHWRGGRQLSSHGYVVLRINGARRYEHIEVAESALERPLRFICTGNALNEEVHHINGNKQDNSRENLLICTREYHASLHHRLARSPNWPEFQKAGRTRKETPHV